MTDPDSSSDWQERVDAMVVDITAAGEALSDRVVAALRAVPRHVFLPGIPLDQVYAAEESVVTKRDAAGRPVSSVSAPRIVAAMLERARLEPGHRVLEIGSGGYNAALLAELVGKQGEVTTVDIDPDVVDRARRSLADAGYSQVRVLRGDGEHGAAEFAPFDAIIVTVAAWDIPPAWTDQLAPDGRLVVPLRLRGLTRTVTFTPEHRHLVSVGHEMSGFVPMRGAGAHDERHVPLLDDAVALRVDGPADVDASALAAALHGPRVERWTGVRFGPTESWDGLHLWLATRVSDLALLTHDRSEQARHLVNPATPFGTPTAVSTDSFAYHTYRLVDGDLAEHGVYAHGPDADHLADHVTDLIRVWDRDHRHGQPPRIRAYPPGTQVEAGPGARVIPKRHTTITISWPLSRA